MASGFGSADDGDLHQDDGGHDLIGHAPLEGDVLAVPVLADPVVVVLVVEGGEAPEERADLGQLVDADEQVRQDAADQAPLHPRVEMRRRVRQDEQRHVHGDDGIDRHVRDGALHLVAGLVAVEHVLVAVRDAVDDEVRKEADAESDGRVRDRGTDESADGRVSRDEHMRVRYHAAGRLTRWPKCG